MLTWDTVHGRPVLHGSPVELAALVHPHDPPAEILQLNPQDENRKQEAHHLKRTPAAAVPEVLRRQKQGDV